MILLVLHLSQQDLLVLLVDIFQVLLLLFLVLEEHFGVLLPDDRLLFVDLLLVNFLLLLFLDLSSQILSHLPFLLLGHSLSPFLFLSFLFQLIFNVFHHLFVLSSNLLLLVLDD